MQCWSKQQALAGFATVLRNTAAVSHRVWAAVRGANAAALELALQGAAPPWEACCLTGTNATHQFCGSTAGNTYPDDYP